MRLIKSMIFLALLLLIGSNAYANGAPIDSNGLVEGGNIKFKEVDDIYVIQEKLDITVSRDYVDVNVQYLLSNQGEERDIDYAFPIFIWLEERGNDSSYLDHIHMKDGKNDLKYTIIETKAEDEKISNRFPGEYGTEKYQNLYSQLHFSEKELKKLNISYRTKGMFLDWGVSNTFLLTQLTDNYFSYDLSPAANWGDGQANLFLVTVDYSDLLKIDGEMKNINLPDFQVDNEIGVYQYSAENYDFKEHALIEIDYSNKAYRQKNYMQKTKMTPGMLKQVKVSSVLEDQGKYNYNARNLFDNDLDTCWAEGAKGYGVGETIEVRLDKGVSLTGIAFINGYIMNKEVYYDNARVKTLKIEHIDSAKQTVFEKVVTFKDVNYEQIDKNYIYNSMQIIQDYGDGAIIDNENEGIRLTILDVFPGRKYKDTCISELLIYGYCLGESNYSENVDKSKIGIGSFY